MARIRAAAAMAVSLSLAVGCSLNPFGGGAPKGPAVAAGEPAPTDAPRKPRESAKLQRFDTNGDSNIGRQELEQALAADFKKEDKNGDDGLDISEARALNDRLRSEQASSPVFDWNADGKVVFVEFASQWRTLFDRSDINRDGVVDDAEMQGRAREMSPRPLPQPAFSGKDGRPPGSQ